MLSIVSTLCVLDSEVVFEKEVLESTFNLNKLGKRSFERNPVRAREWNVEGIKNSKSTPSLKLRVTAILMDIAVDLRQEGFIRKDAISMYAELIELSRTVRNNIYTNSVISCKSWTKMKKEHKEYYCLQLEGLADAKGIQIFRCIDQWAAYLIMSQTMKNKSDTNKKRMERQRNEEVVMIYISKCITCCLLMVMSIQIYESESSLDCDLV